jgi:signal peptidase I
VTSGDKNTYQDTVSGWQQSIVLYLHDLVYLILAIVLVFILLFRIIVVSGSSMYDTLIDGDYLLLLSNSFYHEPKYGDVIVASKDGFDDGAPIIKRVIATQGQIVDIDFQQGIVYVDGLPLEEDYIYSPTTLDEGMMFPLLVEDNCIFVMGDNRGRSKDSRHPEIGLIDKREVLGKALFLFMPGVDEGMTKPEFDRIGVIK